MEFGYRLDYRIACEYIRLILLDYKIIFGIYSNRYFILAHSQLIHSSTMLAYFNHCDIDCSKRRMSWIPSPFKLPPTRAISKRKDEKKTPHIQLARQHNDQCSTLKVGTLKMIIDRYEQSSAYIVYLTASLTSIYATTYV